MLGTNIGIDLGTTSIVIYIEGKGIVLSEPSVAAYDTNSGHLIAVGKKAYEMIGRTPDNIRIVKPMRHGVVSDFTATKHILRFFLSKICKNMIFKPNVVVCVPSMVTNLEKRTILDLITAAGAAKACLIEEPLAAALGAGLKSDRPKGAMVVDIGGGTSEVAVISLGGVVTANSCRVAGDNFDESIISYIKKKYNLLIGERTAEDIKIKIGSAFPYDGEGTMNIKGRNLMDGLPKNVDVTSEEIREAMADPVSQIVDAVKSTLEKTPPELAADIIDHGIMLTGGGALLRGLDRLISAETKIPVLVAENPLDCVVDGTGICLDNDNLNVISNKKYI